MKQQFTAADIERYHKGEMTPGERYELEKAALEDPFLSDAVEGYSYTSHAKEESERLSIQIQQKINTAQIPLYRKNTIWVKAAAILLVVAGSGWLLFKTIYVHQNKIAFTREAPKGNDQKAAIKKQGDSLYVTRTDKQPTAGQPGHLLNKLNENESLKKTPPKENDNTAASNRQMKNKSVITENADANKSLNGKELKRGAQNNYASTTQKKIISGSNNDISLTNKAEHGKIEKTDSEFSAPLKTAPLNNGDARFMEVTVTKEKTSRHIIIIDTLEPKNGWQDFEDYIAANLIRPTRNKKISGKVELSFSVNEEGNAIDIKIEKPLCKECDEIALRLLKYGPEWIKEGSRKGRIAIIF